MMRVAFTPISSDKLRHWLPIALAAAAFLIYAAAVSIVAKDQRNDFATERSSIAAAVSYLAYGAPFGNVYGGVLAQLLNFDIPLDQTLAQAADRKVPPGAIQGTTRDGNGIGYMVIARASMYLLGINTSSLIVAMLFLMAASAVAFLWRFGNRGAVVVVLYFTTLTVMLFTVLTWDRPYILNFGIASIRYYSLVAILPAFHLLLELMETRPWRSRISASVLVPVAVQVMILLLAVLVRNSAATTIGAVIAAFLFIAWRNRSDPFITKNTLQKAACGAIVGVVFIALLILSLSTDYLKSGRFTETVWHRVFVSLGTSPEWPFGKVREIYDCTKYLPQGLVSGPDDENGICILVLHVERNNIPMSQLPTLTYGREYDLAVRNAFFRIASLYPAETLRTFVYTKPKMIVNSIAVSFNFHLSGRHPAMIPLLILSLGVLLLFGFTSPPAGYAAIAGATALLGTFSLMPYIVVWAMAHTSADLLFFLLFGLGLATVVVLGWLKTLIAVRPLAYR